MQSSNKYTIAELVEPVASVLGMSLVVQPGSHQIGGSGMVPFEILGEPMPQAVRVISSLLDRYNGTCAVCVKVGNKSLYVTGVYEQGTGEVQAWILSNPVEFKDPDFWSRKKLYEQFSSLAVGLWWAQYLKAPDFCWTEIKNPAAKCETYLGLRDSKDYSSSEAMKEAFVA